MIFLKILKIIGIILLIIILLILVLLALLLFVPVKYQVNFSKDDDLKAKGKATWLFHFLSIRFLYNNGSGFRLRAKVFGFTLFGTDSKPKKKVKAKDLKQDDIDLASKEFYHLDDQGIEDSETEEKNIDNHAVKESESKAENGEENGFDLNNNDENPPLKKVKKKKKAGFLFRIKNKFKYIWSKIKNYSQIITNEGNKRAISFLLKKVKRILKSILPKHLFLKVKYSLGSPDITAISLGILSMFPIGYQNRWNIIPDFEAETTYFKGKGDISGKIRMSSFVFPALSILLNKDCRRLWKSISN